MPYFNFKFNYMLVDNEESYSVWVTAGRKRHVTSPENFRNQRFHLNKMDYEHDDGVVKIYEHAGWHFTYLGDTEWIRTKLRSFAHTELNRETILEQIDVDAMIENGVGFNPLDNRPFVKILLDEYFPKTLISNKDHYKDLILEGDLPSIKEYFPED
jgi:hypothetical protein